jgi:hypothetical protein
MVSAVKKPPTDRELLIRILKAQCDLARVLSLMNVTGISMREAQALHTELYDLLNGLS